MNLIRKDAMLIAKEAIQEVLPDAAVKKALSDKKITGKIILVAIGKAAWTMAHAAQDRLGEQIEKGVVLTKYQHAKGSIKNLEIIEAGHPLLDENSILGTKKVLDAVSGLSEQDTVLFLISGGGSALFEMPLPGVSLDDILGITDQLLKCGADIIEMNTVRKHLSAVKGGRFAELCLPASIYAIVLSDVLGDRIDSIASGPAYPDCSTSEEALNIIQKYDLKVSKQVLEQLKQETPKNITNCETIITGSVSQLCEAAAKSAERLGYKPLILTTLLDCEAKEAGKFLASMAKTVQKENIPVTPPCAFICGGETVVKITGKGKGGRNQELALSAANAIAGLKNVVVVAIGSDGTDGPTDAAGGLIDGETKSRLEDAGVDIDNVLQNNNSYYALQVSNDLILTGPTGTNVNDLYFVLCK